MYYLHLTFKMFIIKIVQLINLFENDSMFVCVCVKGRLGLCGFVWACMCVCVCVHAHMHASFPPHC